MNLSHSHKTVQERIRDGEFGPPGLDARSFSAQRADYFAEVDRRSLAFKLALEEEANVTEWGEEIKTKLYKGAQWPETTGTRTIDLKLIRERYLALMEIANLAFLEGRKNP